MRMFSIFLCTFLVLMFSGTLTYMYLLWSTYWDRVAKMSDYKPRSSIARETGIHKPDVQTTRQPLSLMDLPLEKFLSHIHRYKQQITGQLSSAVEESGRSVILGNVKNLYHVKYPVNISSNLRSNQSNLLCEIQSINVTTFLQGNPFFEHQQLGSYLPQKPLNLFQGKYNSCAVVSSAGSLIDSNLGTKIDANDYVIRFNNAPVEGLEKDVGKKTSLRIVNSQVVGKPEFGFLDDKQKPLYSDTPVLVWDPCSFNASLEDWYSSPDFPFFETYFAKRLMRPESEVHLLNPMSLWNIWKWLQSEFQYPLLPNPPSSGFLGIVLALQNCIKVHIYEFLPSMRLTKRCHYYDHQENLGCTIGDWHPLAAEKLLSLAMNDASETQVFSEGILSIKSKCSSKLSS